MRRAQNVDPQWPWPQKERFFGLANDLFFHPVYTLTFDKKLTRTYTGETDANEGNISYNKSVPEETPT